MTTDLKSKTIEIIDIFFNQHDAEKLKDNLFEGYIQHNPNVPTGRDTVLNWLVPALHENGVTMENHRTFQDGNYVVTHNSFDNTEPFGFEKLVTFDIWRYDHKGIIQEHWDVLAARGGANAAGRTQLDGQNTTGDHELTVQNKAIVERFIHDFFIEEIPDILNTYVADDLIQHAPDLTDGAIALQARLKGDSYEQLHKVLGEGDLVLSISEGVSAGNPTVFYDLFRLGNGKIVEQWSIYQTIPQEQAHENTMFNFS